MKFCKFLILLELLSIATGETPLIYYSTHKCSDEFCRPMVMKNGSDIAVQGLKDPFSTMSTIWMLYDGERHRVDDWDEFLNFGYSPDDVKLMRAEELESIPMGRPFLRFRGMDPVIQARGDSKIFVVRNGCREPSTIEAVISMGYSAVHIQRLPIFEIDPIPLVYHTTNDCADVCCRPWNRCGDLDPALRAWKESTVYVIKHGCRQPVNWQRLVNEGYSTQCINNVTLLDLEAIPLAYRQPGDCKFSSDESASSGDTESKWKSKEKALVDNGSNFPPVTDPVHTILLVGDLNDRKAIEAFCRKYGEVPSKWLDIFWPGFGCSVPSLGISLRHFHIFGSSAKGPYHEDIGATDETPFVFTEERLAKGLAIYYSTFGPPDRIVFNTVGWDASKVCGKFQDPPKGDFECSGDPVALDAFYTNINARLDQILSFVTDPKWGGSGTKVMLRTSVWFRRGGELFDSFNKAVRDIAIQRSLEFFDLDLYVWSKVDFAVSESKHVFMEPMHPHHFLSQYAEVILQRRYSPFAYFNGAPWYQQVVEKVFGRVPSGDTSEGLLDISFPLIRRHPSPSPSSSSTETTRERGHNSSDLDDIYYYDHTTGLRYAIPCSSFLRTLFLGPMEALPITFMDDIKMGPPIPKEFFQPGNVLNWTPRPSDITADYWFITTCELFPLDSWICLYELPSLDTARLIMPPWGRVIDVGDYSDDDKRWLRLMSSPVASAVPDVFINGSLLQWVPSPMVYLFVDGKLHPIDNPEVAARMGKDLGAAKLLQYGAHYAPLIPKGDMLT